MKTYRAGTILAVAAILATPAVFGQRMVGAGQGDYGASQMAKIFGKNQAFTATAEMSVVDKKRGDPMQMEMSYAFLNGNLRTEMDMTSMKGGHMSPQAAAQMKQMGMDRTISIHRHDKRVMYLVYPGLKSYCEVAVTQTADKAPAKEPKIEITKLGADTVDGHPCVKNKITMTMDDGTQHEVLAWQATDLSDFPIKTEMQTDNGTITTHFRDIKLTAPDAGIFEAPADYQRYDSAQEMMMGSMQRMMGGK
jgi:hypothetical protein